MTIEETLAEILAELKTMNATLRQHIGDNPQDHGGVSGPRKTNANSTKTETNRGKPWSIFDAAKHFGISDKHLRRLIEVGKVRSIQLGHRIFIPDAELQRVANEGTGSDRLES